MYTCVFIVFFFEESEHQREIDGCNDKLNDYEDKMTKACQVFENRHTYTYMYLCTVCTKGLPTEIRELDGFQYIYALKVFNVSINSLQQ